MAKKQFPDYKVVDINELVPYARNSRTHSESQIKKIMASIKEFDFMNPVIIDGDKGIIAGHGRVMDAERLGFKKLPCIEAKHLSEAQKRAYVIADNRLAEDAGWDNDLLKVELEELSGEGFDLALTGFEDDEINKLLEDKEPENDGSGVIPFSEELDESHNYVVLYFDNDLDWLSAQTHFDLDTVHSKRANGKPWSKGIGRVVDGGKYLSELGKK